MSVSDSMRSTSLGKGTKHYMPGLDGLRALSVIAVIAYHLNLPWASGGFLGVGIFFILSGYLITDQLMVQWQSTNRIDLKNFWLRRFRRLMPAVLFMLAIVYLWLALFDRLRLSALQGELMSVLLNFNNWWLIFHKVSYFESFGPASPIGHLWSLSIEAQFYLLWPIILIILLHFVPKRRHLIFSTLIMAAASILAMALIYQPGADPSRVYYGTDTRAFALLIGAAFAIACPSRKLPQHISEKSVRILDFMGGAGLFCILLMILLTNEYDTYLYTWGLAFFSIIAGVVTVVLAHPASRVAKFMGCKPLRWIGVRSYSLYLWHYPVIILTNKAVDTGGLNAGRIILQLVMSFLLAEFSYKFVEEPMRHGLLNRLPENQRFKQNRSAMRARFKRMSLLIPAMVFIFVFIISCTNHIDGGNEPAVSSPAVSEQSQEDIPKAPVEKPSSPTVAPAMPAADTVKQPSAEQSPAADQPSLKAKSGKGVTAIGDSVILDAAPFLEKLLPGICIEGKVGRQMTEAQEVVNHLKAEGKLGNRVIIELGTNGPFDEKQLHKLLTSLGDRKQIILVNVRVPRRWQDTVNSGLKTAASEFPNVTFVDWFSASKGKDSFFGSDGVHLTKTGSSYYASLISKAVKK